MNFNSDQERIAFGYYRDANNKIEVDSGKSAAVKLIYEYYSEGLGLGTIKSNLESIGVPSPRNGQTWSRQTIANILSNPHYVGDDTYPQIITKELFDKVQEIRTSK